MLSAKAPVAPSDIATSGVVIEKLTTDMKWVERTMLLNENMLTMHVMSTLE